MMGPSRVMSFKTLSTKRVTERLLSAISVQVDALEQQIQKLQEEKEVCLNIILWPVNCDVSSTVVIFSRQARNK